VTSSNLFISSSLGGVINIDLVVSSYLLFKFGELSKASRLINWEEKFKAFQEFFLLNHIKVVLIGDLSSKEVNKLQSKLVVLESLNEISILSATIFQILFNVIKIFWDSLR